MEHRPTRHYARSTPGGPRAFRHFLGGRRGREIQTYVRLALPNRSALSRRGCSAKTPRPSRAGISSCVKNGDNGTTRDLHDGFSGRLACPPPGKYSRPGSARNRLSGAMPGSAISPRKAERARCDEALVGVLAGGEHDRAGAGDRRRRLAAGHRRRVRAAHSAELDVDRRGSARCQR